MKDLGCQDGVGCRHEKVRAHKAEKLSPSQQEAEKAKRKAQTKRY